MHFDSGGGLSLVSKQLAKSSPNVISVRLAKIQSNEEGGGGGGYLGLTLSFWGEIVKGGRCTGGEELQQAIGHVKNESTGSILRKTLRFPTAR